MRSSLSFLATNRTTYLDKSVPRDWYVWCKDAHGKTHSRTVTCTPAALKDHVRIMSELHNVIPQAVHTRKR